MTTFNTLGDIYEMSSTYAPPHPRYYIYAITIIDSAYFHAFTIRAIAASVKQLLCAVLPCPMPRLNTAQYRSPTTTSYVTTISFYRLIIATAS